MNTKNGRGRSPRGTAKNRPAETAAKLTGHAKTQATLSWLDSIPYYVSQLALRLPRLHGIILMHLWHVTAGNHRPNAIVPHSRVLDAVSRPDALLDDPCPTPLCTPLAPPSGCSLSLRHSTT
jgi:hypothetical protein